MKKTNKKLWVRALRSGKYKQGEHKLYDSGKYCCLGVAYNELIDGDWERSEWGEWGIPADEDWYEVEVSVLPWRLREKMGLSPDDMYALTEMNDSGADFNEIADWIEKNVLVT